MDAASLARSLESGTTYLKDPVEKLLGHPAAQVISAECVTKTVQTGCRLLTHYTTGAKSRDKPHRWMVLRSVPWEEVLEADPERRLRDPNHPSAAWHGVVHELAKTDRQGAPIICASFFLSNFEAFFDVVRDKFELLDEDDPRIIEAALRDDNFLTVLKLYFDTGSKTNPNFFHTLATVALLNGQCLLHYCCERNFVDCVNYLLENFTPKAAPPHEQWLQLADPLWQERTWKNSAFSIAAYRGYAELLSTLWDWAVRHDVKDQVMALKDKKGKNLCEIIQDRLQRYGNGNVAYSSTFNVIAEAFGMPLLQRVAEQERHDQATDPLLIVDRAGARTTHALPSKDMSLEALTAFFESEALELQGTGVLILRVTLVPSIDAGNERQSADNVLGLLSTCTRVSFMKCSAGCQTTIHMVRAATALFRSGATQWGSLGIVSSWAALPENGAPELEEFADAIEGLLAAVEETCGTADLTGFDMPPGALNYFPPGRRHLPYILSHASTMKRLAFVLGHEGPEQTDLRRRLREDPVAHNPLLSTFSVLERKFLSKSALIQSASVAQAMNDAWKPYVSAMVASLASHVRSLSQWGPRAGLANGGEDEALVKRMADEAVLYLLKMRTSSQRPGLDVLTPAVAALQAQDFPLVAAYASERNLGWEVAE